MPITKLKLANLPTPLWRNDALDEYIGTQVWVKRDDMSAGAEAGNKIRKLEYLLADALQKKATLLITCGGFQSNHARATAILGRGLGMRSLLFLRTTQRPPPTTDRGNAFLDSLVGAEIRTITPQEYTNRTTLMSETAANMERTGERVYVIPEGGSNGLGSLGYIDAMKEIREQLDSGEGGGPARFDAVVHACGSGGTAAGVSLGSSRWEVADSTCAIAVCDDKVYFRQTVERIIAQARNLDDSLYGPNKLEIFDKWKGPAYGVSNREQLHFILDVARLSGLILDPVYTGKALYGLAKMSKKPKRVLFIHTGGLPGLLSQTDEFGALM